MAELQHDENARNDYKSGTIVFTGGTAPSQIVNDDQGLCGRIPLKNSDMALVINCHIYRTTGQTVCNCLG